MQWTGKAKGLGEYLSKRLSPWTNSTESRSINELDGSGDLRAISMQHVHDVGATWSQRDITLVHWQKLIRSLHHLLHWLESKTYTYTIDE